MSVTRSPQTFSRRGVMQLRDKLAGIPGEDGLVTSWAPPAIKIELWYQPRVSTFSWTVVGWEALVRVIWRGVVYPPAAVLPKIPAIHRKALFRHVFHNVVQDLPRLSGGLSINVEPEVLVDPATVALLMAAPALVRHRVFLELVEVPIVDPTSLRGAMAALADSGYHFAVDDFGTDGAGIQSVFLPGIKSVKFDGVFLEEMESHPEKLLIVAGVASTLRFAQKIAVLERVETAEQLFLTYRHFDEIQGYYFGKPHPVDYWNSPAACLDFTELVQKIQAQVVSDESLHKIHDIINETDSGIEEGTDLWRDDSGFLIPGRRRFSESGGDASRLARHESLGEPVPPLPARRVSDPS